MRKLGILMSVLAIALTASVSHASTMSFGVKAGMAIPTGDLGDVLDPGFSGGVYADMWISPQVGFGLDIAGDFLTGEYEDALVGTVDTKLDIIQFGAHGVYAFGMEGSSMAPFIQYGVAMYNGKAKQEASGFEPIEDSSTDVGINGGLGLDFVSGSTMKFGIAGEYHHVFTENDASSYIRVLARLTFLTTPTTQ